MELAGGQKKLLDIGRGLFLIRYESAADASAPPGLVISREGWMPADLEFILPPDVDDPVLWSPGGSLVVRAARAGRITIAIVPAHPGGSTVANVQLMALSEDPLGSRPLEPLNLSDIHVLGHLSGIGDVRVACNEWLGGPASPARIEGIALEIPNLPRSLRLRYSARTGGSKPTTSPVVDAGGFAGTRGHSLPLVGLSFEISGPGASRYKMNSSALFLGSPLMRMSGQRIVLAGPTGREPLVGLQMSIVEAERVSADVTEGWFGFDSESPDDEEAAPAAQSPVDDGAQLSGSVRVFRSRASRSAAATSAAEEVAALIDEKDHVISVDTQSKSKVRVFSRKQLKVNRE